MGVWVRWPRGVCAAAIVMMWSAAVSAQSEGSGTSWLPAESPMYAVHAEAGPWTLMSHENAFLQALHESGRGGETGVGSINWVMGMAERHIGTGHLALRGMVSLEPWTVRGCGYPDLLSSGEICRGETIHDRQHPHDLMMEISAEYDAPLTSATRWQVYGGPAGEPALGPTAFSHRPSAMPDPLAPIAHHWLDSTHVSFGVVTGAVYGSRWKVEASSFNGREPDENRTDFDLGALDSFSARAWLLPTPRLALQVSAGRLKDAEVADVAGAAAPLAPRVTVSRVTASATYHRISDKRLWASTIAWGRNAELDHASNALLVETNVTVGDRDTWFGRFETVGKTADDLDVTAAAVDPGGAPTEAAFTVGKLQGGYTRYLPARRGFKPGVGFVVSMGLVPDALKPVYGGRTNPGAGVYLTIRPAALSRTVAGGAAAGMVMVQTAYDPAKLACAAGFDVQAAPSTTYLGKTYYFCSAADRDAFLKDPAMSLAMRPVRQ